MPVVRYFVFVGGTLIALLFGINLILPQPVGVQPVIVASSGDFPHIRIHSDRKLPDRVVLDTNQPTIVPPASAMAMIVAPKPPVQAASSEALGDMSAKANVRQSFAQLAPKAAKKAKPKRRVARARSVAPGWAASQGRPMVLAQQPHFGFFGMTW